MKIIERNPMRSRTVRIEYKSRKRKTERYLSLVECRTLLPALVGRDHLIVRMFIQLGLRPEERFALRRNDVGKEFVGCASVPWYRRAQVISTRRWLTLRGVHFSAADGVLVSGLADDPLCAGGRDLVGLSGVVVASHAHVRVGVNRRLHVGQERRL